MYSFENGTRNNDLLKCQKLKVKIVIILWQDKEHEIDRKMPYNPALNEPIDAAG